MTDLAFIARGILSESRLALSTAGVPQLYRLRSEFLKKIGDKHTTTDDVNLFDAAVTEIEEAIEAFEKSAMEIPEFMIAVAFDAMMTPVPGAS